MDRRNDFLELDVLRVPVVRVLLEIDRHALLPIIVDEWSSSYDRRFTDGPFVTILFDFPLGSRHGGCVRHNLREVSARAGSRYLKCPVIDGFDPEVGGSGNLAIQGIRGIVNCSAGVERLRVLDIEKEARVGGAIRRIELASP